MKVFHINEFKCTLCSNWFCPPFNLPYRLKCTHSICTNCLEKSVQNHSHHIICPEDLQSNPIADININHSTKKALQRLLKEHKHFTQTNHLECIKSLSINFDELLDSKQLELRNLSTLIDQIFQNEIRRLREIYQKVKLQINRPFRIVNDWKQVVRNYLKKVKSCGPNIKGCVNELNHYIEEGRKIKLDLNEYLKVDFREMIDWLLVQPQVCFVESFSIFDRGNVGGGKVGFSSEMSKFETLGKKVGGNGNEESVNGREIFLHEENNFDQSSIRVNHVGVKEAVENSHLHSHSNSQQQSQSQSNKMSLFQELIHETPKNSKHKLISTKYIDDSRKTPLKEIVYESNLGNLNGKYGNGQSNYQNKNMDDSHNNKISILKKSSVNNNNSQNNGMNEFGQNCVSKYLVEENNNNQIDLQQSHKKDNYGAKIKQKIKNLKTRQEANNNNSISININDQRSFKFGKSSLQYSPEDINYSPQQRNINGFYDQVDSTDDIHGTLVNNYRNIAQNARDSQQGVAKGRQYINGPSSFSAFPHKNNQHPSSHKQSNKKVIKVQQSQEVQQQMLLQQKSTQKSTNNHLHPRPRNDWQLQNLNFLKEWKINKTSKPQQQLEIIQKPGGYDCQKEKNKYAKKIQEHKVKELLEEIQVGENYLALVGHSLANCNMALFLSQINWNETNIEIVKLIKTSLSDLQFNILLNFLARSQVHTLMLSYNNLSEISLDALLNFVEVNQKLKNIYLSKNNISLLKGNARAKLNILKEKGLNLYI